MLIKLVRKSILPLYCKIKYVNKDVIILHNTNLLYHKYIQAFMSSQSRNRLSPIKREVKFDWPKTRSLHST